MRDFELFASVIANGFELRFELSRSGNRIECWRDKRLKITINGARRPCYSDKN